MGSALGKTSVTSARNGTDTTKLRQEGKRDTHRPKQEASKHQNQNILIPFLVVDVVSEPKLVCAAAGQCMSCRINQSSRNLSRVSPRPPVDYDCVIVPEGPTSESL